MWFKQVQLLQFTSTLELSTNALLEKLTPFSFKPCLPSMESSLGWVSPFDTDDEFAPLTRSINGYIMLCLQTEDKILPAAVIRHELDKKIKKVELEENRKVRQNEKLAWKDEIKVTLLPRAFSKFTKLYAYIDTKHRRLVLGTANAKKAEQFIRLFKKSTQAETSAIEISKPSPIMTHWVKHHDYPSAFAVEKAGVLQDPNQQNRIIRCQQQDLFAASIQSLMKEGCVMKQLAINWQDRISFVLSDDFSLKNIKFQDEITLQAKEMEPETKEQQFDADFFIMTEALSQLFNDLLNPFRTQAAATSASASTLADAAAT